MCLLLGALIITAVAATGDCVGLAHADDPFAGVTIKAKPVAGPIVMLVGRGGNIAVSGGPDGVLMVDDQFAPLAGRIAAAVKALGHGPVKWLVNTHWHGDHTGGNSAFGKHARIVAHQNVRRRLASDQVTAFGRAVKAKEPHGLPTITYADGLSRHFNGEEIRLRHLAGGHTDGDSVVEFVGSGVWHLGDLFFNGSFPFVDLKHGGGVADYAKNVGRLVALIPPDARIVPGHGPLATHADLVAFNKICVATNGQVPAAAKGGASLKQAKANGLPADYDRWGGGFINETLWVERVYRSLKGMGMPEPEKK
ncbi:MAG: cyclase [Myxococcota bacterium]|jgi:cyclase